MREAVDRLAVADTTGSACRVFALWLIDRLDCAGRLPGLFGRAEIIAETGISARTLTAWLARLERIGLIERTYTATAPRRLVITAGPGFSR